MIILTRLWRGVVQFTRTMTIGRLAAAYVVAIVLGFVSITVIQVAVGFTGGELTAGVGIIYAICFVLLWISVLIFVSFSIAGVAKLVGSMAGK